MSAAKHTPGPWFTYDPNFLGIAVAVKSDPGTRVLADLSGGKDATEEDRANAALMAAAPDLFDAAERLLEHFSDGLPEHLVQEFREAVAKASAP